MLLPRCWHLPDLRQQVHGGELLPGSQVVVSLPTVSSFGLASPLPLQIAGYRAAYGFAAYFKNRELTNVQSK